MYKEDAARLLDNGHGVSYPAERVYEEEGICTYRAQISGLEPGAYLYRAVDQSSSDVHCFTVQSLDDGFSFLCHGDPQITDGDEADVMEDHSRRDRQGDPQGGDEADVMEDYLQLAEYAMDGDRPQLILSLGDQVDEAGNEEQYRRFTGVSLLKEVPLAAVVGNHERESRMFSRAFCLPNMDPATESSSGDMSGDYWFSRGNTLFLCLNSNNEDAQAHRDFLLQAIQDCAERYGEPVWTVAAFHHSLFSAGRHAEDETVMDLRAPYTPMLEEAGVDVVFSGHDHAYTRSWPMDGQSPLQEKSSGGIVYFTLGSPTGSKFYKLNGDEPEYAAFCNGEPEPTMTRVDVTDDAFTVTTYQKSEEGIVMLDTFQIRQSRR